MKLHMCQSISGALSNWTTKDWKSISEENGMTPEQVKEQFRLWDFEGKKVLPIGEPCEGFSFETGCPGHRGSNDT